MVGTSDLQSGDPLSHSSVGDWCSFGSLNHMDSMSPDAEPCLQLVFDWSIKNQWPMAEQEDRAGTF